MTRRFIAYIVCLLTLLSVGMAVPACAQNKLYRYTHMGNQKFHKNSTESASAYYLKVLKKDPKNSRAMFNLANVYLTKGDVKAADSLYTKVTQTEKNKQICAMAWHNRGYISQKSALQSRDQQQQLLQTAIEQYKQALRLNPRDNNTRYNLALCQKQLKNNPQQNQNNKNNDKNKDKNQKDQNKDQDKNNDKNKDKDKQDQQKKQDKQDQKDKNDQQNQPQNQQQKQQQRQQTEQYMNLAKQAERRALQKVNQHQPRQRSKGKNW